MRKLLLVAAALSALGSPVYAANDGCGVSASAPCHPNNGYGNGGGDGTPGKSGDANGGKKCGTPDVKC